MLVGLDLSNCQGAQFAVSLYVLIAQVNIHLYQSLALLVGVLQFVVDEVQLAVENFHFCRCSRDFVFLLFQKFVLLADEQTAKSHSEQEQENDRQRTLSNFFKPFFLYTS